MSKESATIVQRLWNYCNVLRDDVKFDDALARSERLRHAAPEREVHFEAGV